MIRHLRWAVIVAFAAGCSKEKQSTSAALSTDTVPALASSTPSKVGLELSPQMERALNAYAPGFELFTANEFTTQVASYSQPPSNEPLNRAVGDFNGDGLPDVALYGHDKAREMILAILSMPDSSYKVFPLKEQQAPPHYDHDLAVYLTAEKPGPLEIPEELVKLDSPPRRKHFHTAASTSSTMAKQANCFTGTALVLCS